MSDVLPDEWVPLLFAVTKIAKEAAVRRRGLFSHSWSEARLREWLTAEG